MDSSPTLLIVFPYLDRSQRSQPWSLYRVCVSVAPILSFPLFPLLDLARQVHRTSRSLIASTGVSSEWEHASASVAANPAICRLNADLWYRRCLLPPGHEFLYRTPAHCSNASYGQANVPVTIVVSSKVRRNISPVCMMIGIYYYSRKVEAALELSHFWLTGFLAACP